MANKLVRIREVDATQLPDFPFRLGDEVRIDGDGNAATVEDAVWEGQDASDILHGYVSCSNGGWTDS
jgi:hypothetical protein